MQAVRHNRGRYAQLLRPRRILERRVWSSREKTLHVDRWYQCMQRWDLAEAHAKMDLLSVIPNITLSTFLKIGNNKDDNKDDKKDDKKEDKGSSSSKSLASGSKSNAIGFSYPNTFFSECKQCGKLKNGTPSCCATGGSWQGSCGTNNQGKPYTWTAGIEACAGAISNCGRR